MRSNRQSTAIGEAGWRGVLHDLDRIAGDAQTLTEGLDAAVEVMGARLDCTLGFVYLATAGGGLECRSVWVAGSGRGAMHLEPERPIDFSLPLMALTTGTGQWAELQNGGQDEHPGRQAYAFPVLGVTGVVAVVELVGGEPASKLAELSEDAHLVGVLLGRLAGAREIEEAAERERRRIGRELHDNLGQQLSGLGMFARSLANGLGAEQPELRSQLDLVATGLKQAHAEVRSLSHGLAAAPDAGEGLGRALASCTERTARQCGTACSFTGDESVEVSDPVASTQLLRIAQEALNNAVRHGRAHSIEVDLRRRRGAVTLQIRDDGCGMKAGVDAADGIGLDNMRERAREVGADLSIRSREHAGTVVTCSLPEGVH